MSENQNCKAAGDSSNVENIAPVDKKQIDKLKETGDISFAIENGNRQCTPIENCPLFIKSNDKEQLAEGDIEKVENKEVKLESTDLLISEKENEQVGKEQNDKEDTPINDLTSNSSDASILRREIEVKTKERDNYHKKLVETEKKFAILEAAYNALLNGKDDESGFRKEVENLRILMAQTQLKLDDRIRVVASQENQINALMSQVSSLKDVVNITKDLLNIRNMEVKHLQENVETMEEKINLEREKHNTMLIKMESAFKINLDLKHEYETQLRLFQELREKYDKRVALLTEENNCKAECIDKQNKTI